jgi:hypothetical protein
MQAVATLLALSFNELLIEEIPHGPDRTAYIGTFYGDQYIVEPRANSVHFPGKYTGSSLTASSQSPAI